MHLHRFKQKKNSCFEAATTLDGAYSICCWLVLLCFSYDFCGMIIPRPTTWSLCYGLGVFNFSLAISFNYIIWSLQPCVFLWKKKKYTASLQAVAEMKTWPSFSEPQSRHTGQHMVMIRQEVLALIFPHVDMISTHFTQNQRECVVFPNSLQYKWWKPSFKVSITVKSKATCYLLSWLLM